MQNINQNLYLLIAGIAGVLFLASSLYRHALIRKAE